MYLGLLSKSKKAIASTVCPSSWGGSPSNHLVTWVRMSNCHIANIFRSRVHAEQCNLTKPSFHFSRRLLPKLQLTQRPLCHTCNKVQMKPGGSSVNPEGQSKWSSAEIWLLLVVAQSSDFAGGCQRKCFWKDKPLLPWRLCE